MKLLLSTFFAAALTVLTASTASADPLTADIGWEHRVSQDRTAQFFQFNVSGLSWLRITDNFLTGDSFVLFGLPGSPLFSAPIAGTPGLGGANPSNHQGAFEDIAYEGFELLLGPGAYNVGVSIDGAAGFAAGWGIRLDTIRRDVPEPTSGLLAAGAAAFVFFRRKRRSA